MNYAVSYGKLCIEMFKIINLISIKYIQEGRVLLKKKILSLLTVFCLVFTIIIDSPSIARAESTFTAPQIGDEIHGFTVKETTYDQYTKSNKILFEHNKSGAKLLVIKNNDTNRGFSIKFDTPPSNKGTNHILEHAVLGGSKKYPTMNSIFDIVNTTYVSFANALTFSNMTMYPIASHSEKQLLKSADIYLDAVFNPLILSDQRIFEREGWRLELADESSDLIYNGIVYNEMQGNLGNITTTALSNARMAVFPDTDQGFNAGGIPSEIINLSYEELLEAHNKYYHPSNCLMVLYGDVDYIQFLNMIDKNYLSSYTKQNINIDRSKQKPFEKLLEKTYLFPAAESSETKNKSVIDLVFATDDIKELGMENFMGLELAISLLNLDSSNFKKALMESGIGENYAISLDITTYQPTIHFLAINADSSKSKEFYNLVIKELEKIVQKGLDTDLVISSLRTMEFEKIVGIGDAVSEMMMASLFDNLLDNPMEAYLSYINNIAEKLKENVLEDIIKKQVLENKTVALTVTKPEAGLLEKNQMATMQKLADIKSKMTEDEIKALVNKTAEFNAWNNQATPDDVLKSLRAVNLKDIKIELKDREIIEQTIDGVDLWSISADVDQVSNMEILFDLSHLTKEELLYLKFYNELINNRIATNNRTEKEVINEETKMLYRLTSSIDVVRDNEEDTSAHPVYTLNYYSFEDEYDKTFDLVYDILMQSDIKNISTYGKRTIANLKSNLELQFSEPINQIQYRSMAYTSATYRLYNYLNGLDYYNFILSLEKELDTNPTEVYHKLLIVRAKAFTYNKNNMHILFAGDLGSLDKYINVMPNFTRMFIATDYPKENYDLPKPAKREAIVINSPVQYVAVNASLSDNEVPISDKGMVISTILNNLMLTPEIRLKGGAYGVSAAFANNNYIVITYRDSNYVNSLNIIGATDEFLTSILPYMTEETLESYILSLFGSVNQSFGEINDAMSILIQRYHGSTIQDIIDGLNDLKNTTIADIEAYAQYLSRINENLNYIVVASPAEIEKNKDMFDVILTLD